ncbi:hypothetical protein [Lentzea flava]|uniref:Secreted protein n=1 Tax=Lentzea flava TaxID=103732 RepID=A0ABQ2UBU8_9PSEU|nr:hypothetical protein [Lentzea flava]MCP2197525.1 hypothetical protein [Lentzea flava]GGU20312.1 hypothetical protein GCM10010178_10510 [Lentzea flava]
MSKIRSAVALAATVAGLATGVVFAPTASAANPTWAVTALRSGAPIAKANGDFSNNGGVYATTGINYVDMSNNGRGVYVEVEFWFYLYLGPGLPEAWHMNDVKQTPRTQRMRYVPTELSTRLPGNGSKARAKIKVCEDVPSRGDVCSTKAVVSFDY